MCTWLRARVLVIPTHHNGCAVCNHSYRGQEVNVTITCTLLHTPHAPHHATQDSIETVRTWCAHTEHGSTTSTQQAHKCSLTHTKNHMKLTWNGPIVARSCGAEAYWVGHSPTGMTLNRPWPPRLWKRNCRTCDSDAKDEKLGDVHKWQNHASWDATMQARTQHVRGTCACKTSAFGLSLVCHAHPAWGPAWIHLSTQ